VIFATERARRPHELARRQEPKQPPHYVATCPFCPGNEQQTPPEIARVNGPDGHWQLRVVPNKYAALTPEVPPERRIERSRRMMGGFGHHEVIVESPDHAAHTAIQTASQVANTVRIFKARYDELSLDSRVEHVTIFKNHGVEAGTSLEHPHAQLIATPVISPQVRSRLYEALRHFDEFGECIFCTMLEEELHEECRVVLASDHFVALHPFASYTPFQTYIYPRRHKASFGNISGAEITDLARLLRVVLAKLYVGLNNPDFNYAVRSAPAENAGVKYYHWYLSIIPRLTRVAGFELGSGMFINTVLPEASAAFLRETKVDEPAEAELPAVTSE
jgi:UDPglucose--hexose-1-phosphate uridylyltransferase